jgi:hypothetical protein
MKREWKAVDLLIGSGVAEGRMWFRYTRRLLAPTRANRTPRILRDRDKTCEQHGRQRLARKKRL